MALPHAALFQPSPSPAPAPASNTTSSGPPTKKIKRTNFPDWDATMANRRPSVTRLTPDRVSKTPKPVGSGRLAASRADLAQQKFREEQQAAARALDSAPGEMDDSDSEYFTSSSTGSDDDFESDMDGAKRSGGAAAPSGTHQTDNSTTSRPQLPGVMKPWRVPPGQVTAGSPGPVTPVPLPAIPSQARPAPPMAGSSAVESPRTQTNSRASVAGKPSEHALGNVPKPTPEDRRASNEDEGGSAYQYLTPNELEAKIRSASMQASKSGASGFEEKDLVSSLTRTVGIYGELYTTADGHLYSQLPLPGGGFHVASTLPVPTNYKLHPDEENPFICPVRDCRKIGSTPAFLVGHFAASHNKTKFNDNLDGTLTAVDRYNRGPGIGSPGIVVSRGPPPLGASPPVEPRTSGYVKRMEALATASRLETPASRLETRQSSSRSPVSLSTTQPSRMDMDPIRYLRQDVRLQQDVPTRLDILEMKTRPRKRALPKIWIDLHAGTVIDTAMYACALAYIVGDEVTHSDAKCHAPRWTTARLSVRCIKLPDDLSNHARELFCKTRSCVGCRYYSYLQRQKNACDWGPGPQRDSPTDNGPEPMQLDPADRARMSSTDDVTPAPRGSEIHRRRSLQDQDEQVSRKHHTQSKQDMGRKGSGLRYSTTFTESRAGEASEAQLEMEDWEFAPGRVMNDKDPAANVAFSNSYLTSREPVTISDDISFNVAVVSSGSTLHLTVEASKLRTCSVATGKVKVIIGGTEFKIGPHGMFKVMPGEDCKVENRHYMDAYIHCTTVENYEFIRR